MQDIYLIRHGESIMNVEKKFCGWNECDLTKNGEEQAKKMAEEINKLNIQKVYSSPLKRAYKTARAISDRVITDEGLKELNFGEFDSVPFEEVNNKFTNLANELLEGEFDFTYPNGENRYEFYERVTRTFDKIIHNDTSDKIIMVTHSCVIRSLLSYVFTSSPSLYFRLNIGNCGISKISFFEKDNKIYKIVKYINREIEIN